MINNWLRKQNRIKDTDESNSGENTPCEEIISIINTHISTIFKSFGLLFESKKNKTNDLQNTYFIKINTSSNYLSLKDFIAIVSSFKTITENLCELCQINANDLQINIISATTGCFNINIGLINISGNDFNLANFTGAKYDLSLYIIKSLTGKDPSSYTNKLQLLKDLITGYITKNIAKNDKNLAYVDIKKSNEAKKIILRTIKKQPNTNSAAFNGEIITTSEIDLMI